MTPTNFDAAIKEIIISQEKPRSTGNSFFRKLNDKRRWRRLIKPELLKNPARNFYNRFIKPSNSWDIFSDYDYIYFCGIGGIYRGVGGVRYSSLTGRLKLCANCEPRRKVKTKRIVKRLQRRNPRRFKGDIANGAEYKRLHLKSTY